MNAKILAFLILILSCRLKLYSCTCTKGEVFAMTSNGRNCNICGNSNKNPNSWIWHICRRMKNGVTVTKQVETDKATKFKRYLDSNKIKSVDLFMIKNDVMVMGIKSDRVVCFPLLQVSSNGNGPQSCDVYGVTAPSNTEGLTGFERINYNRTIYGIFLYRSDSKQKFIIINEKTKETFVNVITDDTRITAISYFGSSIRNYLPTIGAITDHDVAIIYELNGAKLDTVVDKKSNDNLFGCVSNICLEGNVDSVYTSDYRDVGRDRKIFVTRNHETYRIVEGSVFHIPTDEIQYETTFVVHGLDSMNKTNPILCYISGVNILAYPYGRNVISVESKVYNIQDVLKQFPRNSIIFTTMQISETNYYFFVDNKIFEYENIIQQRNIEMKLIAIHTTQDRFKNLWNTFDAAFKDPKENITYFFNQDFHVRYQWKDGDMMEPMDTEPRLNQKTFWNCSADSVDNYTLVTGFNVDTLDAYYNNVVKKYRLIPLPADDGTVERKVSKQEKKPKWIIPVIIIASVMILLLIIAILAAINYQRKRKNNVSRSTERTLKPKPSFVSVSTTKEPITKGQSNIKPKRVLK